MTGDQRPTIEAVIVNHGTSRFSELALRSLVASLSTDPPFVLTITVADNHSTDEALGSLKSACADLGAVFELTRFPAADATVNTHGDVLRDFVLAHRDADYFLLLDCDIDFEEPETVERMLVDLLADDTLWAVQARFRWIEENRGEGSSLDIWARQPIALRVGRQIDRWDNVATFSGVIRPRLHPGCALLRNSLQILRATEIVGFASAVLESGDEAAAGFFDTAGLLSAAMGAAGFRYALSRAVVHHFFMASYDDEHVEARNADVEKRLARFGKR